MNGNNPSIEQLRPNAHLDREIRRLAMELATGIDALGTGPLLLPVILSRVMMLTSEESLSREIKKNALANEPQPLSPDQLAWANQKYSDEDYISGLRDIEQTGGVRIDALLSAVARTKERL